MTRNLVDVSPFGAFERGDLITDAGEISAVESCEQAALVVAVAASAVGFFDGDATLATDAGCVAPVLSAGQTVVTIELGSADMIGAVLSTRTKAAGRWYLALRFDFTGTPTMYLAAAGWAGSGFNVHEPATTTGGNLAAMTGVYSQSGGFEGGISSPTKGLYAITAVPPVTGEIWLVYMDRDAGTWGIINSSNINTANIQARNSTTTDLVGMPAGTLSPVVLLAGEGVGAVSLTVLPDAALGGLTLPVGYTNIFG